MKAKFKPLWPRSIGLHLKALSYESFLILIAAFSIFAQTGEITKDKNDGTPLAGSNAETKANPAAGQQDESGDKTKADDDDTAKQKKEKRGSLVPAPIPIISPTFGSGIVLGLGYVFQLKQSDKVSPPSSIGGAVAFTDSGTRGGAFGANLYFAENKYQTTFAFGKGRAIYDFYGVGLRPGQPEVSVRLNQGGTVFFAEFMRNFGKNIFIGPRYQYRKLTVHVDSAPVPGGFEVPAIDLVSTTAALGFHISRDLRDNSFYPTKGSLWNVTGDFFAKALGSKRNYQVYKASYNGYRTIGKDQILAYRGSLCSVSDNTPFYDLCLYGSSSDLRGYTTGQFQDRRMFATQAEYRRHLFWRLGVVGFGGVGGVARRWGEFRFDELLPAGGFGLRFLLVKKHRINYRIDVGFGREGRTISMSVTEAF